MKNTILILALSSIAVSGWAQEKQKDSIKNLKEVVVSGVQNKYAVKEPSNIV